MNISDLIPWRSERSRLPVRREESPFYALRQEMDSLFDDFTRGFDLEPWSGRLWNGDGMTFNPRVNVSENEKEIQVTAELPGLDPQDVDISLARDVLTIRGEKKEEKKEEKDNYYRVERSYGSFSRTIPLPGGVVNPDQVDATFKNGVLTVVLPKREEAQSATRRITVKAD